MTVKEKFHSISSGSFPWDCTEWDCIANTLAEQEAKVDCMQLPYDGVKP